MKGKDLSVGHGAPLRLRVERQLGYKQAKYLMRIQMVDSSHHLWGGHAAIGKTAATNGMRGSERGGDARRGGAPDCAIRIRHRPAIRPMASARG